MRRVAAAFLLTFALAAPASSGAEDPLSRMLALMPQAPAIEPAEPLFSYMNLAALYELSGAPARSEQALMTNARRMVAGPRELREQALYMIGDMRPVMGFDWFDIEQAMSFWAPPRAVIVLAGAEPLGDGGAMSAALEPRGFSMEMIEGVPVWHRYDDFQIDLRYREMADPFGGAMGRSARIAVQPGLLIGTSNWDDMRAVLRGAPAQAVPALQDAVRAISELGGSGGSPVLQAVAFAPETFAGEAGGPTFTFALLADSQRDDDQVLTVAVSYFGGVPAEAADTLEAQLRRWTSAQQSAVEIAVRIVSSAHWQHELLVATLQTPVAVDPDKGSWLMSDALQAVARRDFPPLSELR
jgi:hypothetical protein